MENKRVIGIYGVFSVGKSFLAHGLSSKLLDYDTVATDNLLAIARSVYNSDPYLQSSSYLAWKLIGEKTSENIVEGFKKYRNGLQPFIRTILQRAHQQRVDMILEGVHISPEIFQEYSSLLEVTPLLVTIKDKEVHWARVQEKCKDRPALLKRIEPHFDTARDLQEFLIEEAQTCGVTTIDNSIEKERTLDLMLQKI